MSDFATLKSDAVAFFDTLAQNNNRAWWQEIISSYYTQLKSPALALLETLT